MLVSGGGGGAGRAGVAGGATVRRTEWSSRAEGLQQHAQLETTQWNAPQHSYGKVVAGVAMVSGGHAVQARRQVEVLSARQPGAPGLLRVMRTSTTTSSSTTKGHRHFDDLQLSVNPLDISSQRERSSVGRSGALGGRRPPSRGRPAPSDARQQEQAPEEPVPESLERLTSPAIVANGVSRFSSNGENRVSNVDIAEVKSESEKCFAGPNDNKDTESKYKVQYPDNDSEESFYDSCPEKDSIFKDESEQLEEWRRTSKIRRSLQFPRKHSSPGKPLDLPDNWGSVSRIRRELESIHNLSSSSLNKYHNKLTTSSLENSVIQEEETESNFSKKMSVSENFLIKPSTLKTKSFISLETLNEVRGRLKNFSNENEGLIKEQVTQNDKDDGIDTEEASAKVEEEMSTDSKKTSVRSYVFGMEAMLDARNEKKQKYPGDSNSLESRVSKMTNSSSNRSDDWYMRRKSYGFEKVGQKTDSNTLTNHEKGRIESSTDSGICQSSELVSSVSSLSHCNISGSGSDQLKPSRRTIVTVGNLEKRETFEDWLQKNRKAFSANLQNGTNKYKCLQDIGVDPPTQLKNDNLHNVQYSDGVFVNIPIKSENSPLLDSKKQIFSRKLSEGTTLSVESDEPEISTLKTEDVIPYHLKRHTIAVDGIKEIRDIYEMKNSVGTKAMFSSYNAGNKTDDNCDDNNEKRNKKVEFCKTEVHFAAESGRVNIVETDGKPPSTNNFRRRRRSSGVIPTKESDKSKLPVMHFGDNVHENKGIEKENAILENCNDITNLNHNYAVATDVKSSSIISQNQYIEKETVPILPVNGDLSESEPKGILKNKPIKPRPYYLGEEKEVHTENDDSEQNLWGVKLRPVKKTEDPSLWKSSVMLNNNPQLINNDNDIIQVNTKELTQKVSKDLDFLTSVDEVNKINKELVNVKKPGVEASSKGYSTKVNFGDGDAIIETSFRQVEAKNSFVNSEGNKEVLHPSKNTTTSKFENASSVSSQFTSTASSKSCLVNERKQNLEKCMTALIMPIDKSTNNSTKDDNFAEETKGSTFADSITTPRSLMPARGSARKLKEHELSYFGIKETKSNENNISRTQLPGERIQQKVRNEDSSKTVVSNKRLSAETYVKKVTSSKERANNTSSCPIYENVTQGKKLTLNDPSQTKLKHPGESIIEELTKAADEILQALNGYSGEESGHRNTSEEDEELQYLKNGRKIIKPLETISEMHTHKNKTKVLENKAVQTNLSSRDKYNSTVLTSKKTRTSSNSSIDSISREAKLSSAQAKSKVIESVQPERPQRKKGSSLEVVKARRLHRASSREALLKIHGSSSEDIPTHIDITKKKVSRRSRHSDIKKHSSNTSLNTHSSTATIEEGKESNRLTLKSFSSILPEIRHKTAVSTIKSVNEKSASKERSSSRTKPSTKERSRRRDKLQEATISSLNRVKSLHREKSRSADTSLDREQNHLKDRIKGKDSASYHGDETVENTTNVRYVSSRRRNGSHERVRTKDSSTHQTELHDIREKSHHRDRSQDKLTSYHRNESHDKMRTRDSSTNRSEKVHDTRKLRESSSHRRERSQDKLNIREEPSDSFKDKREKHVSRRDRSQDKIKLSHPRDKSYDRDVTRKTKDEVTKRRKMLSIGTGTGTVTASGVGATEQSAVRVPATTSDRATPSSIRASHTRTEHDKSCR